MDHYRIVDELDLQHNLPKEVLTGRPNPEPKDGSMDGCKEGAVEPPTTLGNELIK